MQINTSVKSAQTNASMREKTYHRIRAYVLSGELDPKERLNQQFWAGKFHVSRTPIKEALYRLEQEGIIEQAGTRGFRISEMSLEELETLFDIRSILEGYSMKYICQSINDEVIEHLSCLINNAQDALNRADIKEIIKWTTKFHTKLYNLIEPNRRLHNMIINMLEYTIRYRIDTFKHLEACKKTIDSHKKILFALEMRDSNLCEYLMRQHIQQSKKDAIRIAFGHEQIKIHNNDDSLVTTTIS